jgi:hypothetical protein
MRNMFNVIITVFCLFTLSVTGAFARTAIVSGVPVEATIMRSGATAPKVARIKKVPSVGIVNLRRLHSGFYFNFRNNRDPLDNLVTPAFLEYRLIVDRNRAGVKRLRAALKANPVTRKALATRGISINRVVGVELSSNGSLRVYVL